MTTLAFHRKADKLALLLTDMARSAIQIGMDADEREIGLAVLFKYLAAVLPIL